MRKRSFNRRGNTALGKAVIIGMFIQVLVTLSGLMVGATLLSGETINASRTELLSHAVQFFAMLAGGITMLILTEEKRIVGIGILTVCYCAILICASLVVSNSPFKSIGSGLLSVMLGALAPCALCIIGGTRSKRLKGTYG